MAPSSQLSKSLLSQRLSRERLQISQQACSTVSLTMLNTDDQIWADHQVCLVWHWMAQTPTEQVCVRVRVMYENATTPKRLAAVKITKGYSDKHQTVGCKTHLLFAADWTIACTVEWHSKAGEVEFNQATWECTRGKSELHSTALLGRNMVK